jgi:pimeloyl-ACP methyl ester carboxylesterase
MNVLMRALGVAMVLSSGSVLAAGGPSGTEMDIPGPAGPLKGTLTRPAPGMPPLAAVLVVPGSGPTDRDGNNPMGIQAATYRLLAEGLASRGIATLRIDKRGLFGSAAAIPDANAVTIGDYATDVQAWSAALRQQAGTPCNWLLGHSEGGLVALAAAARHPEGLCGLVLVATPGRPLGEVLRAQLRANPANAPVLDSALAAIASLEHGRRVDVTPLHPALKALFNPSVQGFLIDAFSYDPRQLVAHVSLPVLVLQGERDLQVSVADAKALVQANPHARLVLLPDTNHVLKQVVWDDPKANLATYGDPTLPLAPAVVEAIAEFVAPGPRATGAHGGAADRGGSEARQ